VVEVEQAEKKKTEEAKFTLSQWPGDHASVEDREERSIWQRN
jgi:hypothetical protein